MVRFKDPVQSRMFLRGGAEVEDPVGRLLDELRASVKNSSVECCAEPWYVCSCDGGATVVALDPHLIQTHNHQHSLSPSAAPLLCFGIGVVAAFGSGWLEQRESD